jgi:hypothetical protein
METKTCPHCGHLATRGHPRDIEGMDCDAGQFPNLLAWDCVNCTKTFYTEERDETL